MKISEAISQLQKAKRKLGDVDVVYITDQQIRDVWCIYPMLHTNDDLKWWSGPVAVVVELV